MGINPRELTARNSEPRWIFFRFGDGRLQMFVIYQCCILLFGNKKSPIYSREISLTNWRAPSPARPTNADNPNVLPNVGANARPNDKIAVNRLPPNCFLILVLASFISIPFFNSRFFSQHLMEHTACHFRIESPSWLLEQLSPSLDKHY